MSVPRVAYLPDTFHEVNGVARTARELTGFASRMDLPFLCICPGGSWRQWRDRSVEHVELSRSDLSVQVEADLRQDPVLFRYLPRLRRHFQAFRPQLVHVTSMGDFGLLGWRLAREFGLPMVASWHTNVHEYAAWRFRNVAAAMPARPRDAIAGQIERVTLALSMWFYRKGVVSLAPNADLVELLRTATRRPTFLMERGVDTRLFDPSRRARDDSVLVLGYVGRLSTEKNLRLFKKLEDALRAEGLADYRIQIVGHGAEAEWLQRNLRSVTMPGVLEGETLAKACADMDIFLLPSHTDTYGNVVWEATASGVPAVVTNSGGPQYIVRAGETGLVSRSDAEFVANVIALFRDGPRRQRMGRAARVAAERQSWDAVFHRLYSEAYATAVRGRTGRASVDGVADGRPDLMGGRRRFSGLEVGRDPTAVEDPLDRAGH